MTDMLAYLALPGGIVLFLWLLVGAFVWLRWGYAGAALIWGRRKEIDDYVRQELKEHLRMEM